MGLQYCTCARSSCMLTRDNMEASLQPCLWPLLYSKVSCEVATDYEFCMYICVQFLYDSNKFHWLWYCREVLVNCIIGFGGVHKSYVHVSLHFSAGILGKPFLPDVLGLWKMSASGVFRRSSTENFPVISTVVCTTFFKCLGHEILRFLVDSWI